MPELVLDEGRHIYYLGDLVLPGVTTVLQDVGIINPVFYTNYGRERGKAVHLACRFLDMGTLDWESVDETILEYVVAWQRFRVESGSLIKQSETPLYHPIYFYAGTPDRDVEIGGVPTVVDIKTGEIESWMGLQLAGYAELFPKPHRRLAVQLRDNGTYLLHYFDDRNDAKIFLSAVGIYHWKRNQKGGSNGNRDIAA